MPGSKFDKDTNEMREFNLQDKAHMSDGLESPPRLSEALIHAMPTTSDATLLQLNPQDRYRTTMKRLFQVVYERLDKGLDEAWRSAWGYDGDPDDSPDEKWARVFSEMFVFTAYLGVARTLGTAKSDSGEWDIEYVTRLDDRQPDPVYPFFGACQHLANYMVLTRGLPSSELGTSNAGNVVKGKTTPNIGLGAGINKGRLCFTAKNGGAWLDTTDRNLATLKAQLPDKRLTPGSMFCFDSPAESVHIGGVLRVSKSGNQMQPMDTGVLAGADDTGTADHNGKANLYVVKPNLAGLGVLRKTPPPASYLDFIATARPLGFAHFVVVDEDGRARYISRALPMYHGAKNFAVSRYVWSLRCLPLAGQAFWILSTCNFKDFSVALARAGARDQPLGVLAAGAKDMTNETLFHPLNVLASTKGIPDNGAHGAGAAVYRRKFKGADVWSRYRGGEQPYSSKSLPGDLSEVRVNWDEPFYQRWKSMKADEEFTRADWTVTGNPQLTDITAGVPYFSGTPAPSPSAPKPTA